MLLRLLVGICLGLGLVACSPTDNTPLKIGSNVWPGYELFYLARSMGELDETQVRMVEFTNSTDVSHQLVNGNLHAALLTLDEAVRLKQSGLDIKVVQIVDFSRGGDVVMGHSSLKSNEDILGKSIAVEASAVGALMLSSFLRHLDIPKEHLNIQYISVDESEKAFKSGVDFVVTFEPFRTYLLNLGAIQVFDSRAIPNLIVDVLVIRDDAIERLYNGQMTHVMEGYLTALDYFKSEPEQASSLIAKRLKITPEEALASYEGIDLATLADSNQLLTGSNPKILNSIDRISEILLEANLITETIEAPSLIIKDYNLPVNRDER